MGYFYIQKLIADPRLIIILEEELRSRKKEDEQRKLNRIEED